MNEFNDVIQYFDDSTISCLMSVPESVKEKINEIRIKVDEPIVIITKADAARVDFSKKGKITAAFGLSIGAVIFILMM